MKKEKKTKARQGEEKKCNSNGITQPETEPKVYGRLVLKGKNNVIEDQYSIAFIDADGTWICVHFKDQDKANQLSTDNLEDIIELLDPNLFLRVHKCGIINMECVIGVRYYARNIIAILEGPNEITVALSKKEIFNKMYNDVKQKRALKAMQNIVQR